MLLKAFGVSVTEYQARTRQLLARQKAASTRADEERLQREAAELSADLNRALREITNHVLQLQSDFLMELVARPQTSDQPKGN
jgi:uncharacterized protein YlxW (UPF0749 family)